jgi:segregation and condensation protein B
MSQTPSLEAILEALLLASSQPLNLKTLAHITQQEPLLIQRSLEHLARKWGDDPVLTLYCNAAGWQLVIRGSFAPYLERLFEQKPQKLSKAVLETLALIAYKGPMTRSDIEDIRGVAVNPTTIRQLIDLEWIEVVGHKDAPGKPQIFATTKKFLCDFQLKSLQDLPEYLQTSTHEEASVD